MELTDEELQMVLSALAAYRDILNAAYPKTESLPYAVQVAARTEANRLLLLSEKVKERGWQVLKERKTEVSQ